MAKHRTATQRMLDLIVENQTGALIGTVVGCLPLVIVVAMGLALGGGSIIGGTIISLIPIGVSVYCFVQYTSDPDILWPLIVCVFLTGFVGWILIVLGAVIGAVVERAVQARKS